MRCASRHVELSHRSRERTLGSATERRFFRLRSTGEPFFCDQIVVRSPETSGGLRLSAEACSTLRGAGSHRSGETGFFLAVTALSGVRVQKHGGGGGSQVRHPVSVMVRLGQLMIPTPMSWSITPATDLVILDEIPVIHEDRLNGGQGEIDHDDRAACEEALKAAQANLKASQQ